MTRILAMIADMELAGNLTLTRWGTALAHFLWQGAVLAVFAWVLMALLKRATPQVRYTALVAVLGVMMACPIVTFWLIGADEGPELRDNIARIGAAPLSEYGRGDEVTKPEDRSHVAPDFTRDGAALLNHVVDSGSRPGDSPAWVALVRQSGARLQANAHWLVLAWCGGVVLLSIRLVAGIIGVERAKRYGVRPAAAIEAAVAALTLRLRVSRPVRVLESTVAEVPTVVGWLRPFILLPASAMTGLTTAELEAVLAHELAHVRRHDYLVNVAQIVVETLLFYHPVVWWLSAQIRREREHCCDDWAVAICGNRVTYARALVALEGLRRPASGLALAASGGSLSERVLRLVGRTTPRSTNRSGWWTAALVVMVVMALVCVGAAVSTRADELATQEAENDALTSDEPSELAEFARDEAESRREPAGSWDFHFRQLGDTGFQVESRVVRKADGNDEQLVDIIGGVGLTLDKLGDQKIDIEADDVRIWSNLPMPNALTDAPLNSPTKLSCRGNVRLRRGTMSLSAKQLTLDLCRKLLVAEGVVVLSPDGFEFRADRLERNLDESQSVGVESRRVPDAVEAHELPAATWGEVRNGWQLGVRWKSGRVNHEVGEKAWYEVVARNPGEEPMTVRVTRGEHSDVTLYAGNKFKIRIHGQEREELTLAAGAEQVLDVWRARLSTDGLPEGEYKVAVRMPDDDVPQPPPLGLRLTAPGKPGEQVVSRDFKKSAVPADDDKPVNNPETIIWGEPVLGLQAGVRYTAGSSRRPLDGTIETEVLLRNTTKGEVAIEYLHHTPLDFAPEVRDGDGREIEALLMVTGPKFDESRILPPNEPVLIGKARFQVRSRNGGVQEAPSVVAPAGKYIYSTGLHIGQTNQAYVGMQLSTGELPLELVAEEGDGTATEAIEAKVDGPAKTVFAFLEAVRTGNGTEANAMLTRRAREKTAALDMVVAPPGSKTASFTIGEAKVLPADESESSAEVAHVPTTWTDNNKNGDPHSDEVIWALRHEPEGWRIAGMTTKTFEDQPPLLLNFEDPGDMQRKQQLAVEEMQRRTRQEKRGGEAREDEIGRAVQRGVEYLKSQQNVQNGRWEELAGFPGGVTALCALALLKTGVAPDDPAIEKALGRLRSLGEPKKTYSTALATLVFCAADPERDRALIERNVRWLEKVQKREGGPLAGAWAYPESEGDNSNTGFAVMALYEAERANIKAAPETWRRVLDYWVRTQNADGSWGYKPDLPGTGSMTCSGISSLAAAAEVLGENDPDGAPRQALARGLGWMGINFSVHSNPGAHGQGWLLYYLKGVECVGRLTKQPLIGEHDWYREGAALLIDTQDKLSGFWKGQGHVEDHPQVGTSFALMFLANGGKEKE